MYTYLWSPDCYQINGVDVGYIIIAHVVYMFFSHTVYTYFCAFVCIDIYDSLGGYHLWHFVVYTYL